MKRMIASRFLLHLFFWLFSFAFVLDYFYDSAALGGSIYYTTVECVMYALFAYTNLFLLIPKIFEKYGLVAYILSLLGLIILVYLPYQFLGFEEELMGEISLRSKISFSLNAVLFVIISGLYWYVEQYQAAKQRTVLLRNEKLAAELDQLKAQISPHFLFNSLNNIYSLCVSKSDEAPEMVEKLSDILRYLIYEGRQNRVPLSHELDMLKNYFEMQKMKKVKGGDNVEFSAEIGNVDLKIAPLMLINFVENAFKHGDVQTNIEGYVRLNAKVSDGKLHFSISNSHRKKLNDSGIGMENVKKQLELAYPDTHHLNINIGDNNFSVELEIQLS